VQLIVGFAWWCRALRFGGLFSAATDAALLLQVESELLFVYQ
jgi:hypothetical protein